MADNLFLSYELMYLMHWLLKHEKSKLKALIKHVIEGGLGAQLSNMKKQDQSINKNLDTSLQNSFIEFLYFVENELLNHLENAENQEYYQEDLLASLKKLNLKNIDMDIVWTSVQQAKSALEKNAEKQPVASLETNEVKDVLLAKVLKNWKPKKFDPVS